MDRSFEFYKTSADYVAAQIDFKPEIGVILGSALGDIGEQVENAVRIKYKDIPNFLSSSAPGHKGELILGDLCGKKVAFMSGRFHYYEGYENEQLSVSVRLFSLLGCSTVILTNAAGGVNTDYRPGDIMVISDHIKLNGSSPLRGDNIEEFGERFPNMVDIYTPELRKLALEVAKKSSLRFHEGVYFYMPGPQYETPAEVRAIRILGGDAAGMSTVAEAITAAHCKMPCLGFSVITNMAAGITGKPTTQAEVTESTAVIMMRFQEYFKDLLSAM